MEGLGSGEEELMDGFLSKPDPPFSVIKSQVLVCMEKKKLLGLKRLLEAGGAEVILPTSSYVSPSHKTPLLNMNYKLPIFVPPSSLPTFRSVSIRGLTHALINMGYFPSDLVSICSGASQLVSLPLP